MLPLRTLLVCGVLAVAPAHAEVVLPLDAPAAQPSAAPTAQIGTEAAAAANEIPDFAEVDPGLRHLPASRRDLRFEGETAAGEWPVHLTTAQAGAAAELQIGYLNGVSVMPEGSTITASVNDVDIGAVQISSPGTLARMKWPVPAGLLQPGYNAIAFRVSQRHRVDCTLDGTYELWTQLYPGTTGLSFGKTSSGFDRFADLAAVNVGEGGELRIRLRAGDGVSAARTARLVRAAGLAALATGAARTNVEVNPAPGEGPGLDIAMGTPAELKALGVTRADEVGQGRVSLVLPDDLNLVESRLSIVIAGTTETALDTALAGFEAQIQGIERVGSPAGLRALANLKARAVEPGTELSFRDLGVRSEDFNGRLYRASFDIRLPYDFLAADYAKAALRLTAGYAPGLTHESRILVRLNGRTSAVLPLGNKRGEVMRGREIPLPLSAMHPGVNRVDVEAQVPSPADGQCDALAGLSGGSRFVMIDDSALYIPRVARMARLPEVSATLGGGFPYGGSGPAMAFIPHPDRDTLAAAATLTANMAIGAQAPLNLAMAFSAPPLDAGNALVVGAMRDLPPGMLDLHGLDAQGLQQAWQAQLLQPTRTSPSEPASTGATGTTAAAEATPTGGASPPRGVSQRTVTLEAWQREIRQSGHSGGTLERAWRWLQTQIGLSRRHIGFAGGTERLTVEPEATLVIAQARAPNASGASWTLATAASAAELRESLAEIGDRALLPQLGGQAIAFDRRTGAVTTVAGSTSYFVTTQPISLGNLRLVAAGWFSLNIGYYVMALLAAAALLGTATWLFVRRIGHGD